MAKEYDYEQDLEIDTFDLEKEWVGQASLYMKYAELCADAERAMNDLHEQVKVRRSVMTVECKTNNPKATGPEIEAYYRTDEKHMDLKKQFIDAQHDYRILDMATRAFSSRKIALENITRLQLSSFYGEPKAPSEDPDFVPNARRKSVEGRIKRTSTRTRGGKKAPAKK